MADPKNIVVQMDSEETAAAVNSILNKTQNEENHNDKPLANNKRTIDEVENEADKRTDRQHTQDNKKPFIKRYYSELNKGPFEIIVQSKDKKRLNPFAVGKILQNHHEEIKYIDRSGNNLTVTCNSYTSANNLVDSPHLAHLNVFVPTNKIHSVGVVMIEPGISEEDILNEIHCSNGTQIVTVMRMKRMREKTLVESNFVKVIFQSDSLPEYAYLNYVRLRVEVYRIPVKQCYRCFAYSHTANQIGKNQIGACEAKRLCRDCGEDFHSEPCENPKKCVHCLGSHSSNSRYCPEFIRQRNIKDRMTDKKEDFFTASKYFPITYKVTKYSRINSKSYAQIIATPSTSRKQEVYTYTANRFEALSEDESESSKETPSPVMPTKWLKPKTPPLPKYHYKNKTATSYGQQLNHSTPGKAVTKEPPQSTSLPRETNRDLLLPLLKEKLMELKNKISTQTITTKKQVTDMFELYINSVEIQSGQGTNLATNSGSRSPNTGGPPVKQLDQRRNGK